MKQNFKDLVVWQRAMDLVPVVYQVVQSLPKEETYALGSQIRRAMISVPANIAEGQARQHPKEFLQHLAIAKGSLAELLTLLIVCQRLNYIQEPTLKDLEHQISLIARPLHGLMNRLK